MLDIWDRIQALGIRVYQNDCGHHTDKPHCTQGYTVDSMLDNEQAPYPDLTPNCGDGMCDGEAHGAKRDIEDILEDLVQRVEAT